MAKEPDPFHLQRFLEAQAPVYDHVVAELREGHKRTHWMWFIFPQIAGLGSSPMATKYAISSPAEARAYLAHPVLGARLEECVSLVNQHEGRAIEAMLGHPDDMKFRSSLTLFHHVAPESSVFQEALDRFYAGAPDPLTLARL